MKKIWDYLRNHILEDINAGHYLVVFIFLGTCIYFNYTLRFHQGFLSLQVGVVKFVCYLLFYSTAYFVTVVSYSFFYKRTDFLKTKKFWIKSLLVLSSLALDTSLPFFRNWINENFASEIQFWVYKVLNNLVSLITVLLPLLLFYFFREKKEMHMYGLQAKHFDLKPYFFMLLLMLPLIVTASSHDSFLNQYPMYKTSGAHTYLGLPEWVTTGMY